jgi:regulator of replication initiation timing
MAKKRRPSNYPKTYRRKTKRRTIKRKKSRKTKQRGGAGDISFEVLQSRLAQQQEEHDKIVKRIQNDHIMESQENNERVQTSLSELTATNDRLLGENNELHSENEQMRLLLEEVLAERARDRASREPGPQPKGKGERQTWVRKYEAWHAAPLDPLTEKVKRLIHPGEEIIAAGETTLGEAKSTNPDEDRF